MATIKSYTDLSQTKKLMRILSLESADMYYTPSLIKGHTGYFPHLKRKFPIDWDIEQAIPCWSLAALLGVLPFHIITNNQCYAFSMHKGLNKDGETYMVRYNVFNTDVCLYETEYYNNLIDACYEMILKLHERKML